MVFPLYTTMLLYSLINWLHGNFIIILNKYYCNQGTIYIIILMSPHHTDMFCKQTQVARWMFRVFESDVGVEHSEREATRDCRRLRYYLAQWLTDTVGSRVIICRVPNFLQNIPRSELPLLKLYVLFREITTH